MREIEREIESVLAASSAPPPRAAPVAPAKESQQHSQPRPEAAQTSKSARLAYTTVDSFGWDQVCDDNGNQEEETKGGS